MPAAADPRLVLAAARRIYSPTVVRPIPTDRAITRSLAPQAYFRRRTSRTFRIDNLSAGIVASPSAGIAKGRRCLAQIADNAPRLSLSTGWPPSIGIGGRFRSDWVAALPRNHWPLSVGSSGRLASDSAPPTGAVLRRTSGNLPSTFR
jgi:hypothetical protein